MYVRGRYALLAIYGAIVGTVRRENPKEVIMLDRFKARVRKNPKKRDHTIHTYVQRKGVPVSMYHNFGRARSAVQYSTYLHTSESLPDT